MEFAHWLQIRDTSGKQQQKSCLTKGLTLATSSGQERRFILTWLLAWMFSYGCAEKEGFVRDDNEMQIMAMWMPTAVTCGGTVWATAHRLTQWKSRWHNHFMTLKIQMFGPKKFMLSHKHVPSKFFTVWLLKSLATTHIWCQPGCYHSVWWKVV